MKIKITEIDWDDGNYLKCQKHGVSIEEIEKFLLSDDIRIINDYKHSDPEKRYIAVGKTLENRGLFVAFTFRVKQGLIFIRPISSRYMHQKEIDCHEQKIT